MQGALSIVLVAAAWVNAQSSSAPSPSPSPTPTGVPTCNQGFSWAFNSLDQSPCQLAASLAEACLVPGTNFAIQALAPSDAYNGPAAGQTTNCRCSSVYYSALSACALCQGGGITTWTQYDHNCTTLFLGVFPTVIPSGVTVPHWAYLDVSAGNGEFNATLAQSVGGAESSAIPQPTAGATPTASTHKKSHAGAIAGGVVGGVIGLLLISISVFALLRMRNRKQAIGPILDEPQSENGTMLGDGKTNPYGGTPKLYDPNDPQSFSLAMAQLTGSTHSFPSQGRQFTGTPSALSRPNAQYQGVAEVM